MGAAGTVTGSSYVLTSSSGQSILIDLGMFQGTEDIERLNFDQYTFDCSQLQAAFLTHAHLDHCGRLPLLLKGGYSGRIFMTAPTIDLTALSLLDSAQIAVQEGHGLYDKDLALQTISRFSSVSYRTPKRYGDFLVTFRDAGHILGSASLEIEDTSATSEPRKIVFSGDLGNSPEELVSPTEYIDTSDIVVMESTYGDRLHPQGDPTDLLQEEISIIEKTHSTLLIPAFSLERTQELLHMIKHLKESGRVAPSTPVFLDGPMAQKATEVYVRFPSFFNPHISSELETSDPFEFPGLTVIDTHKGSLALHERKGTKVIIAGSGMMVGGRILNHASYYLPLPSTRLLIVGYQGEQTLGRELLEGSRDVLIQGESVHVAATVTSTQAMSSHADQSQLFSWLNHIKGVDHVILTHGEDDSRKAFSDFISSALSLKNISLPYLHEELSL
jgi:metallo-beta-lactamase family protein